MLLQTETKGFPGGGKEHPSREQIFKIVKVIMPFNSEQTAGCSDRTLVSFSRFTGPIKVLLGVLLFTLFHNPVHATQNVTLGWGPSSDPNVVGYKTYYGAASGNYTNSHAVGNVTTNTVSGLARGVTYYFVVTAYNASGVESVPSNVVGYTVPSTNSTPVPVVIGTTSLAGGTVNLVYTATLTASGGTLPYTWAITSGSLPAGLTLNTASGAITGTPTTTGSFNFTIRVSDATLPAQQTATQSLTIIISAAPTVVSIWPSTAVPQSRTTERTVPWSLGSSSSLDVAGSITGIRFYKAGANTDTHVGNLWTSTGTLLATATFTGESASGWQQVNFATPVAITANTVYVASYHATIGHYSINDNYFATNGFDNPPLHALTNGVSGGNGCYAYGASTLSRT